MILLLVRSRSEIERLASSEIRMPVWRRSSTIAEMRESVLQASRRARYSSLLKTRGGLRSYLGWLTVAAGLTSTRFSAFR